MYLWTQNKLADKAVPQHQQVIENQKAIPFVLGSEIDYFLIEVIHLVLHEEVLEQMRRDILDKESLIELLDLFDEVAGVDEGKLELKDRGVPPSTVFLG